MNAFESVSDKVINLFENNDWVKCIYEGTKPAQTQTEKELNLVYGAISKHCAKCMNINGCCFPIEKQDGLRQETDCAVYEGDIAII